MKYTLITLTMSLALATACSKKPADAAPEGVAPKGGEKAPAAAPAASAFIPVDKLGVTLEMPGDAKAEPGAGDSFMIMSASASDCVVMLGKENPDMADSYDRTLGQIKEGKMGNGKLKAVSKEEKGEDGGWKIEWTAEGSMDPAKVVYGVDYRVVIDGAMYGCSRRTRTAEGQACVAKACGSLKKI